MLYVTMVRCEVRFAKEVSDSPNLSLGCDKHKELITHLDSRCFIISIVLYLPQQPSIIDDFFF